MKTRARQVAEKLTKHVHSTIHQMHDSTLRDLLREVRGLTTMNCAWPLYAMRTALLELAEDEQMRRTARKESGGC